MELMRTTGLDTAACGVAALARHTPGPPSHLLLGPAARAEQRRPWPCDGGSPGPSCLAVHTLPPGVHHRTPVLPDRLRGALVPARGLQRGVPVLRSLRR